MKIQIVEKITLKKVKQDCDCLFLDLGKKVNYVNLIRFDTNKKTLQYIKDFFKEITKTITKYDCLIITHRLKNIKFTISNHQSYFRLMMDSLITDLSLIKRYVLDKNREFVFYGADHCIFCQRTHKLFNKKKITYQFIDIMSNPKLIRPYLNKISNNFPTVPVIFHQGNLIGGLRELTIFLKDYCL